MRATHTPTPADGPRLSQVVLWVAFTALLVVGLALYFMYAGRIVPILDGAGVR